MLSLLDNIGIQGRASTYGVVSYVTPYITHNGTKGGPPFAYSDHIIDQCHARAVGENKTAQFDMTRFFNAQVAPSIIRQLEVFRMNWGIPRYIYTRGVRTLSPNACLKRVRTHGEVAADGRGDGSPFTKRSIIQLYGDRLRHVSFATAPMGPHPMAPPSSWAGSSWGYLDTIT